MNISSVFNDSVENFDAWMVILIETDEILCREGRRYWMSNYFEVEDDKVLLFWSGEKLNFIIWLKQELETYSDDEESGVPKEMLNPEKIDMIRISVVNKKIIL